MVIYIFALFFMVFVDQGFACGPPLHGLQPGVLPPMIAGGYHVEVPPLDADFDLAAAPAKL